MQTVKFSLDPLNEDQDGKEYLPNTYREVVSKTFVTDTKDAATNTDPLPQVCIHFIGTGYVIFLTITFSHCRKLLNLRKPPLHRKNKLQDVLKEAYGKEIQSKIYRIKFLSCFPSQLPKKKMTRQVPRNQVSRYD